MVSTFYWEDWTYKVDRYKDSKIDFTHSIWHFINIVSIFVTDHSKDRLYDISRLSTDDLRTTFQQEELTQVA